MRPRDCTRVVPVNVAIAPARGDRTSSTTASSESGSALSRKAPPETGGISADFVAVHQSAIPVGVFLVHGVEEALGLGAEIECRPDVGDSIDPVELALAPAGAFAQARKQANAHGHEAQIIARAATLSE